MDKTRNQRVCVKYFRSSPHYYRTVFTKRAFTEKLGTGCIHEKNKFPSGIMINFS